MPTKRHSRVRARELVYTVAIHLIGRGLLLPLLITGLLVGVVTYLLATTVITATASHRSATVSNPTPMVRSPADQLVLTVAADSPHVTALDGSWVPQLASASTGADDRAYLQAHQRLAATYGSLLLTSDEYAFARPGYWVSIAPTAFSDSAGAQAWCQQQARTYDDCYPQLLTRDAPLRPKRPLELP